MQWSYHCYQVRVYVTLCIYQALNDCTDFVETVQSGFVSSTRMYRVNSHYKYAISVNNYNKLYSYMLKICCAHFIEEFNTNGS